MIAARSVLAAGATLGEGPAWIGGALWFVDIKQKLVYRYDPAADRAQQWAAPAEVGWILPATGGRMIAGLQSGVHRFDPATGCFTLLHDPEPDQPGNRLNDATVDRRGRLWFGSMDNGESRPSGRLYLYAQGRCADSGLAPVAITNRPAISADGDMLYHSDTLGRLIWRVPIHDDGTLGTPVRHIAIEPGVGYPDGTVVDAENCLWTGLFGGSAVRRYDPAGKLIRAVALPCANVTKLAFGGAALDTAYVTTARKGLSAVELQRQPEAGNLFAFDPGVAGLPLAEADI